MLIESGGGNVVQQRAEETVLLPSGLGWHDYPHDTLLADLIEAAPGYEMSKIATQVANELWKEKQQPTLYLMLTHAAIIERLAFIKEDGEQDNWSHYQGHLKSCQISKWANHGYS